MCHVRELEHLNEGAKQQPRREHVVILCSETGGGHLAAAIGVRDGLHARFGDAVTVTISDPWSEWSCWPFNTLVSTYRFMASHPWLWAAFYFLTSLEFVMYLLERWSVWTCAARFRRFFELQQPTAIVSVHPMCQHLPLKVLEGMNGGKRQIPFIVVVTDLGNCHPLWFHKKADALLAPSAVVRDLALKHGIPSHRIRLTGMPVKAAFWRQPAEAAAEAAAAAAAAAAAPVSGRLARNLPRAKEEARIALGLEPQLPLVLLVGGADGVGRLSVLTQALVRRLGEDIPGGSQILVVCGKNSAAKAHLEQVAWPKQVRVVAAGYVSNMDVLMRAADCIVTKAGTSTVCEAAASGLPVMLSSHLPGQEAGNIPFVVEQGFGAYCTQPAGIASTVSGWLRSPALLQTMRAAALAAVSGEAALKVALEVANFMPLSSGKEQQAPAKANGSSGARASLSLADAAAAVACGPIIAPRQRQRRLAG